MYNLRYAFYIFGITFFTFIMNFPYFVEIVKQGYIIPDPLNIFNHNRSISYLYNIIPVLFLIHYLFFLMIDIVFGKYRLVIIFLILLCNCMVSYYQYFFQIEINQNIIAAFFDSNFQEIKELISIKLLFALFTLFLLPCCYLYFFQQNTTFLVKIKYFVILMLIIITILLQIFFTYDHKKNLFYDRFSRHQFRDDVTYFLPFNYLKATYKYIKEDIFYQNTDLDTSSIKHPILEDLKVILIIGESSRLDRWSINGYKKNTSPLIQTLDHVISYNNVTSLSTSTLYALPHILKRNIADSSSIISVFNKIGFETYWFANQMSQHKRMLTMMLEAKNYSFNIDPEGYDFGLVRILRDKLTNEGNQFFILHTKGSHFEYDNRYPASFRFFRPTCKDLNQLSECRNLSALNNSYDNSILYTDYVIYNIIKILNNTKSIVIFVSDHGESLGENGVFTHGKSYHSAPKEQKEIFMMLWGSNKFWDMVGDAKFLEAKKNHSVHIDQSYIYHTILDCLDISGSFVVKEKSICSKAKNAK